MTKSASDSPFPMPQWRRLHSDELPATWALLQATRGVDFDHGRWAERLAHTLNGKSGCALFGLVDPRGTVLAVFCYALEGPPGARLLRVRDVACTEIAGTDVVLHAMVVAILDLAASHAADGVELAIEPLEAAERLERVARRHGLVMHGTLWSLAAAETTASTVVPFPGPRR
jgi:hypothetical protein